MLTHVVKIPKVTLTKMLTSNCEQGVANTPGSFFTLIIFSRNPLLFNSIRNFFVMMSMKQCRMSLCVHDLICDEIWPVRFVVAVMAPSYGLR